MKENKMNQTDGLLKRTLSIIENDGLKNVSNQLQEMNKKMNSVYKNVNGGYFSKLPIVRNLIISADNRMFKLKTIVDKVETIFNNYDNCFNELEKSLGMYKDFNEKLDSEIKSINKHIDSIKNKKDEDNKIYINNLNVLIGNLELAKKRLSVRERVGFKLLKAMETNQPIFKSILSVCIIENAGQNIIESGLNTINNMGSMIDNMISDMTNRTIESSRNVEKLDKPVFDLNKFKENVNKLNENFKELQGLKKKIIKDIEKDKKTFKESLNKLQNIK